MPVASTVCPTCGYPEADPEHIREKGVLRAVILTCRLCGTATMLSWPDPDKPIARR